MRNSIINLILKLSLFANKNITTSIYQTLSLFNKYLFIAGYTSSSQHECLLVPSRGRSYITLSQYISILMRTLKVMTFTKLGFSEATYAT